MLCQTWMSQFVRSLCCHGLARAQLGAWSWNGQFLNGGHQHGILQQIAFAPTFESLSPLSSGSVILTGQTYQCPSAGVKRCRRDARRFKMPQTYRHDQAKLSKVDTSKLSPEQKRKFKELTQLRGKHAPLLLA